MAIEDIGGLHALKINGITYDMIGNPTYKPGGITRTPKMSKGKTVGYVVNTDNPAEITCTIANTSLVDLAGVQGIKDATVELLEPNGKNFVIEHATITEVVEVNGEEGEISLTIQGDFGGEQK